jgi:predicted amidohydrolase
VQAYQALAKELNICLVPGTIVEQHDLNKASSDKRQKQEAEARQNSQLPKTVIVERHALSSGNLNDYKMQKQEEETDRKSKLVNVVYFIDNKGDILGSYQKKNIWHPERPHLTSSAQDEHQAIDTPLGKVGLLICWDLAFPEAFRELIARGAKTIIIPTYCKRGFLYCFMNFLLQDTSFLKVSE